ncbi:MAG: phenol hydroxylase [Pseudomonas sp. CO183]|nr:MAG: phenol hydroxylase [Pseudomonas sp. BRH_c35]OCX91325.1 MAG: phenol hydroxylase [Pseudomonas sp. CO183]
MSVRAISEYTAVPKDVQANFHGMQLLYVCWEKHLMFCAPFAFLVAPNMIFSDFLDQVFNPAIAAHPDSAQADLMREAVWMLDDKPFNPDPKSTLKDNGIGHKSMLTLSTPGFEGILGCAF